MRAVFWIGFDEAGILNPMMHRAIGSRCCTCAAVSRKHYDFFPSGGRSFSCESQTFSSLAARADPSCELHRAVNASRGGEQQTTMPNRRASCRGKPVDFVVWSPDADRGQCHAVTNGDGIIIALAGGCGDRNTAWGCGCDTCS